MTLPSREFLVRQATLTMLARLYPLTSKRFGNGAVGNRLLSLIENNFAEGRSFIEAVGVEFRALSSRFAAAA